MSDWEDVIDQQSSGKNNPRVRRLRVPHGWLYQVAVMTQDTQVSYPSAWLAPVFVKESCDHL